MGTVIKIHPVQTIFTKIKEETRIFFGNVEVKGYKLNLLLARKKPPGGLRCQAGAKTWDEEKRQNN